MCAAPAVTPPLTDAEIAEGEKLYRENDRDFYIARRALAALRETKAKLAAAERKIERLEEEAEDARAVRMADML